jgi:hypothetical protein
MLPYDTATFATAQAGSTSGRMAASWRCLGFTLAATSRPSRRARESCLSAPTKGRFPAASSNLSLARPGHEQPHGEVADSGRSMACSWPTPVLWLQGLLDRTFKAAAQAMRAFVLRA